MLSDIEIAKQAKMLKIGEVAAKLGISEDEYEPYGHYKAKLSESLYAKTKNDPDGRLILVTAINPTPAGEGKTTISVGLAESMNKIGKKAILALREPSLGPVFGIKGGAAGGGYAQVVPMEDINLHFTGDMHAITAANNLLCALIDNHMQQGNELHIDQRRILFKRCLDMNDRALRDIVIGLGSKVNGIPREDSFQITVASEIMAILCLASDLADLKARIEKILVAHGCNSVRATKLALKLADYTITEAGFGSDLGAEKFFDIKCRYAGLKPSCVVLVATVRALKYNGGVPKTELTNENVEALEKGIVNLKTHIENMHKFGVPVVVAINRFHTDTEAELAVIERVCGEMGVEFSLAEIFAKGSEGGIDLAEKVCKTIETKPSEFKPLYDEKLPIKEKLDILAKEIYRANGVIYTKQAEKAIKEITDLGFGDIPVCVAKTQYSLSDDPTKLGKPENYEITVRDVRLSAGAGFVVAYTGDIMTMPGLPKKPAAYNIDCDNEGNIYGLF